MKKIIKALNEDSYGNEIVISEENIYIHDLDGYVIITYDRVEKVIRALEKVDITIMENFIQLITKIERDWVKTQSFFWCVVM